MPDFKEAQRKQDTWYKKADHLLTPPPLWGPGTLVSSLTEVLVRPWGMLGGGKVNTPSTVSLTSASESLQLCAPQNKPNAVRHHYFRVCVLPGVPVFLFL